MNNFFRHHTDYATCRNFLFKLSQVKMGFLIRQIETYATKSLAYQLEHKFKQAWSDKVTNIIMKTKCKENENTIINQTRTYSFKHGIIKLNNWISILAKSEYAISDVKKSKARLQSASMPYILVIHRPGANLEFLEGDLRFFCTAGKLFKKRSKMTISGIFQKF